MVPSAKAPGELLDTPRSSCRNDILQVHRGLHRYRRRIDLTGFPGLLGGPHNHQFGAWAARLLEVNTPESVQHSSRVRRERSALLLQWSLEDYKDAVNFVALGAGGSSEPNASHSPAQASNRPSFGRGAHSAYRPLHAVHCLRAHASLRQRLLLVRPLRRHAFSKSWVVLICCSEGHARLSG